MGDLITSMVNEKNLEVIIQRLTDHLYGTDGAYRDHVLEEIILVCSRSDYEFVRDFAWYVQLMCNMTTLSSMCKSNAELVSSQLMDVTIRVPEVREFSVQQMEKIIIENGLISDAHNMQSNAICRILEASAYIVGEYSEFVTGHITLVSAMLQSRIASLPQEIQCIFIHNALKVVCAGLPDNDLIEATIKLLEPLTTSSFIEVQERSNAYLFFLKWFIAQTDDEEAIILSFRQLFSSELMPLHPNSQQVIADKVPNGLSLDDWIGEPFPDDSSDDDSLLSDIETQNVDDWYSDGQKDEIWTESSTKGKKKLTAKQKAALERQSNARKARQTGPWYIA